MKWRRGKSECGADDGGRERREKERGRGRFGPERIHLMKRGEKQALDRAHKGKVHRRQLGRNTSAGEERGRVREVEGEGGKKAGDTLFLDIFFLTPSHTLQQKEEREGRQAAAVFNGLHSTKA